MPLSLDIPAGLATRPTHSEGSGLVPEVGGEEAFALTWASLQGLTKDLDTRIASLLELVAEARQASS